MCCLKDSTHVQTLQCFIIKSLCVCVCACQVCLCVLTPVVTLFGCIVLSGWKCCPVLSEEAGRTLCLHTQKHAHTHTHTHTVPRHGGRSISSQKSADSCSVFLVLVWLPHLCHRWSEVEGKKDILFFSGFLLLL